MIDAATVDRILDSVRIEEVIGDFVTLRKRGANYLGLCPFHQDKNPSMSVSSTKGIFKCFSCGKAGTAVSFVMEHEHLTYPEALRYLAKKYNIEIVEKEESAEEIAGRMRHESLQIVTEYAQKYYQDVLWNTDTGRAIGLSYFRERKFTDETIRKFGLGYAAGRQHELYKDALQKGYKREYLLDTGLCVERDNGDLADRFFDRVMFPIYSVSGRVIAFG
ncbi:MAG: CHC2 zinc finger domain-containing protein, partial [Bacteroidales bacterium]|nr:CHC2 zinc finger domain-containing protein [Bacteroidales bacterium]